MTDLYLIRHGIAEDRERFAGQDGDRPLTPKGKAKTAQVAQRLSDLGLGFDLIVTSPLVRAYQTAEILQRAGLGKRLEIVDYLAPGGDLSAWLAWLATWHPGEHQRLALVGHQPDLGQWAEILVWGQSRDCLVVKKAGIIGLTLTDPPMGQSFLFWLTPPRLLL